MHSVISASSFYSILSNGTYVVDNIIIKNEKFSIEIEFIYLFFAVYFKKCDIPNKE